MRTPFQEHLADLAAVLATLYECHQRKLGPLGDGQQIESHIYRGLDSDPARWERVKASLLRVKYITVSSHLISLTPEGLKHAEKINTLIEKK